MKLSLILCALLSLSTFASKFKALNIKEGLWRYEIIENSAVDSLLAKVPEAQRKMMKEMMKAKMKSYDACQTKDMLQDPEGKFKEAVSKNPDMKDCEFEVIKSSKEFNHSKIKCPKQNNNMDIKVKVISETEQEQTVISNLPTPDTKIVVRAVWVGACEKKDPSN